MDDPEGDGLAKTLAQAGVQAPIQGGLARQRLAAQEQAARLVDLAGDDART